MEDAANAICIGLNLGRPRRCARELSVSPHKLEDDALHLKEIAKRELFCGPPGTGT